MNRFIRWSLPLLLVALSLPDRSIAQEELPTPPIQGGFPIPSQPDLPVDPAIAGWQQAGPGANTGSLLRSHWVVLGPTGNVSGVVRQAETAAVPLDVYVLRQGRVVNQTRTDSRGQFQLEGLTSGVYCLMGYSPNSLFAFGVVLLDDSTASRHYPRSLDVRALHWTDKGRAASLLHQAAAGVQFRSFGEYPFGQDRIDHAAQFGWSGLSQFDVPSQPATSIQSRSIVLADDGRLRGRLHQIGHRDGRPLPLEQTKVVLLEQGEIVAETMCERTGCFEFIGMPSGEFGLVAMGIDGVAALGITLHNPQDRWQSRSKPPGKPASQFVSTEPAPPAFGKAGQTGNSPRLDLSLVPTESTGWLNHHLLETEFSEARQRPRSQATAGQCCRHCLEIIISGQSCGCSR